MEKYLFIDRDGTLVAEPEDEQVDSLEKIVFEPEVIPALRKLADYGYTLIMVSNQDGLGTSSFPQEDFETAQNFIVNTLSSQGVTFREILICPHFPHEGCHCRKPQTGLVEKYLRRTDWDRKNSYVIGDRDTDVKLAENMGIGSFKYHRTDLCWMDIADKIIRKDRTAHVIRNTRETQIDLYINLDHPQDSSISTGIGFFDHMLDQIATHGNFQLVLKVKGDLEVDEHHTVEDVGICLGKAFTQALGNKKGITRYGDICLPMDETLILAAVDISGRGMLCDALNIPTQKVGSFDTELCHEFFVALARDAGLTLHIRQLAGSNSHHIIEGVFKAVARCLKAAVRIDPDFADEIPSTKGLIE